MKTAETETDERGGYIQLFVYQVPKTNHDAFAEAQGKLASIFKKHGVVLSEFFLLSACNPFKGFTDIAQTLSASPEDEIWLELEHYKDAKNKDEVVADIGKDPLASPLFGQVIGVCDKSTLLLQGDFSRYEVP